VYSEHPGKEFGKFVLSHGKFFNDADNDKGAYLGNYILSFICTVVCIQRTHGSIKVAVFKRNRIVKQVRKLLLH
jgi:hypothetical protein